MKRTLTLIFLTIICSFSVNTKAQTVNFPDENFLEYILLYTTIDANKDGEIQVSEAEAYTGDFTITGSITNLTGIEYFKNLTVLTINGAKVSALNIASNKQLQRIYIYKTLISKIDITANTNIMFFDVKENPSLTEFKIGQNSQLQFASLMFNNVSAIDVTKCPKLTNLFLTSNNLTSIDITQNPRLAEFNLAANKVTSLDISKNTRLTYLNIGYNKITQLDVTNNTLLDTFMIQGNPINTIDVSKTKYLRQFVMDNTGITSVDLAPLTMLQYFYANYSQLSTIDASSNASMIYINAVENSKMKFINFKNGFNKNAIGFFATSSPNLKCIQVDNVAYSSSQSLWQKDATAVFATDCSSILASNEVATAAKTAVYPNPAKDYLYLSNDADEVTVFNWAGQRVAGYKKTKMIDISHLSAGSYIVRITDSKGMTSSTKVVKN